MSRWLSTLPLTLIMQKAKAYHVDHKLLAAIVMTESSGDANATRFEEGWKYFYKPDVWAKRLDIKEAEERKAQATSWGLCQIMGAVAREMGFAPLLPTLTRPDINLEYGCIVLRKLQSKFPERKDVIAAYNAGFPRRKDDGTYVNQRYVDKVTSYLEDFKNVERS